MYTDSRMKDQFTLINFFRSLDCLFSTDMISLEKELAEQKQVASIHEQSRLINVFPHQTVFALFEMENVGRQDCQENPNEHLRNLRHGNPNRIEPLGLHSDRHEEIVKIHHRVNTVVHGDEKGTGRRIVHVCMPSKQ